MQSDHIGHVVPLRAPTTSPVHNLLGIVSYAPFHHLTTNNDIGTAAAGEPGQVEGTPELRLRPFPPLTTNNEIGATAVAEPNQVEGNPALLGTCRNRMRYACVSPATLCMSHSMIPDSGIVSYAPFLLCITTSCPIIPDPGTVSNALLPGPDPTFDVFSALH